MRTELRGGLGNKSAAMKGKYLRGDLGIKRFRRLVDERLLWLGRDAA